jgi:hypothetical protein
MKHSTFVDGEAMSAIEGVDVTHLLGSATIVDIQEEPQRSAFNAYRVAFRANEAEPNLKHAAALVNAWNALAEIMGLGSV